MAAYELFYTSLRTDANLKAYYRFSSGALTTDSSGNGNTLTNNNSVAEGTGQFDGGADLGSANSDKTLNIADDLALSRHAQTISCWIKLNAEIASGEWVFWGINSNENDDGLELAYQYNGGTIRLVGQYNKNGVAPSGVINYTLTMGTASWYHVVFTWTGDATANGLKLYVNGSNVGNATATLGTGSVGGDDIRIGARNQGVYGFASCIFDDFAIFDRVLSSTEISNLYNGLLGSSSASSSISPSVSPSLSPSISPSASPSLSPSVSPSISPSISPSVSPSSSNSPSASLSISPSISPSVSPSSSLSPSISSSLSPSISPSVSPSFEDIKPHGRIIAIRPHSSSKDYYIANLEPLIKPI